MTALTTDERKDEQDEIEVTIGIDYFKSRDAW
jgi:hypothetical protein